MENITKNEIDEVKIGRKDEIIDLINNLLIKVKKAIESDLKINMGDIVQLVTFVMELVEKSPLTLTSKEKLYVATNVITKSLDDIPGLNKVDKDDIKLLVPNTIEIIAEASKGKFSFGKKKNKKENKIKVDTVKVSNQLYDRMIKFIKNNKYSPEDITKNIFIILTQVMSLIDEYPSLTGSEKKFIITNIMNKLVNDIDKIFPNITNEQKHALKFAMKMVPTLIDSLINAARGQIDINKIIKHVTGCFGRLFKKSKK